MTTLDLITREDLQQFKTELFDELKKMQMLPAVANSPRKWLKSADVRKMLNISPGTLQTLRMTSVMPFSRVGTLLFYRLEDIERLLQAGFSKNVK